MAALVKEKKSFRWLTLIVYTGVIATVTLVAINLVTSAMKSDHLPLFKTIAPKAVQKTSREGTYMKLRNLNFRLNEDIDLKVIDLFAEAIPIKPNKVVNFDDVNSFAIDIFQGEILVPIRVLEVLFNKYIFNFSDSPLKNLKMEFVDIEIDKKKERRLKLTGEMKLVFWINFEMIGKIELDKKTMVMVISAEKIKSLGNPFTKNMLELFGLNLEKLMKVPSGRGILMKQNQIITDPFAIFPPPKIGGYISELQLRDNQLYLKFENSFRLNFPPLPEPKAKNYLFLYQGDVKFGKLFMVDARLQMVDLDPKDDFDFYLAKYFVPLVKGHSKIQGDGSVIAYIPDYQD